jgi:CheY-like chemotaxis protein
MEAQPAADRTLTAVVVDDDPHVRRSIKALASGSGVRVVAETKTIIEAVLLTARHHPDLVIIDELTQDLDAGQAARALRATRPGLFVVGLSAHPDRTSPKWANCFVDRTKISELPLILGAALRMLEQENRLLEVEAKLDASRGILDLLRREWGSLSDARTRLLVDELAGSVDGLRTRLEAIHEAWRGQASLIQVVRADYNGAPPRRPRPRLREVNTRNGGDQVSAQVILEAGDRKLVGQSSRGAGNGSAAYPPVAEAILDAVGGLLKEPVDVRDFDVIQVGDMSLAVVLFQRAEDTLVGSARVRDEVPDAVARASLDGLNRFLDAPSDKVEIRL